MNRIAPQTGSKYATSITIARGNSIIFMGAKYAGWALYDKVGI